MTQCRRRRRDHPLTAKIPWRSLLRLNPSNNSSNDLLNCQVGGVNDVHPPARIAALPTGPTLPLHLTQLSLPDYILAPLGIDGVHALPGRPRKHVLCRSVCPSLP